MRPLERCLDAARTAGFGLKREAFGVTEPDVKPDEDRFLDPADPQEAAYRTLHAERAALEEDLALLQHRQRFGSDENDIASARAAESALLKDLDRVLTLIRAAEIKRQQPQARRWQ